MPINTERIIRRFMQLVAIDAPSYNERAMADELTQQLLMLGVSVQEDDAGTVLGGSAVKSGAKIQDSRSLEGCMTHRPIQIQYIGLFRLKLGVIQKPAALTVRLLCNGKKQF